MFTIENDLRHAAFTVCALNAFDYDVKPGDTIKAFFKNGRAITYTTNVFTMLVNDPEVVEIIDAKTGELLYKAD